MTEITENKKKWAFRKGFESLQKRDSRKVKMEIMNRLGIKRTNTVSFYKKMNGSTELKISEAETVKEIFEKYGITDFWGE